MNTDQKFRSYVRVTAVGLRVAFELSCHRFLTCICLTARFYSIKKIQCNTVTSQQCCSLCDNLDSRYLYTCMDAERGRGEIRKNNTSS